MDNRGKNGNQVGKAVNKAATTDAGPSKISRFFAFSEKLLSREYLRWLIIAFLPVLILLRYTVDRVDYDLWWQLAQGKYYIMHHTLKMDFSVFSWTPTDPTWIYNTCLGSIIIYLFYTFMGGFGLWVLQWLVFIGVFLSFYFFLRLLKQRLDINSATMIAAIGIVCSLACRFYKPELFSLLIFPWTVFLFFNIKITRRKFLFYIYPLMFVFWVNLHGAFIVGLAFLAMAFAGEILNRIFFPRESFTTEELIHFGVAGVLTLAITVVNPYGVDYPLSIFKGIITGGSEIGKVHSKWVMAYMSLWPHLKSTGLNFFGAGISAWLMTLMAASILALCVYEIIKRRTADFMVVIVSLGLYWKGMETSRALYFFPVAFFFIFFYMLIFRLDLKRILDKATFFSILFFLFFYVSISFVNVRYGADPKWFGAGLENFVPVKEVAFLKKYHLEGPIFNDYVVGGYLVWDLYPDYKVFIDPRGGLYMNRVFPDYIDFTSKHVKAEDINRFRAKYPFNIVFLHFRQLALIFDFLAAGDNDWRLVYFEKNAAILMHKSLMPAVQTEMGNVNLSPLRFREVTNPDILINVFSFYVRLDPEAGKCIYNIFKNNVSDWYNAKPEILRAMQIDIQRREKEARDKASWMSP